MDPYRWKSDLRYIKYILVYTGTPYIWVEPSLPTVVISNSVSRSDTDTVQVTGVGFDAVIACGREKIEATLVTGIGFA